MIQHPRPFDGISKDYSCWYWYLWWWTEQFLEQIVQISVIFISNKSNSKKIKEWYHVSLTSNISAKTWSNCTCRGCFENVRTSRFQICPWFWKSTKICGSNRAKQNITDFFPLLYNTTNCIHYSIFIHSVKILNIRNESFERSCGTW